MFGKLALDWKPFLVNPLTPKPYKTRLQGSGLRTTFRSSLFTPEGAFNNQLGIMLTKHVLTRMMKEMFKNSNLEMTFGQLVGNLLRCKSCIVLSVERDTDFLPLFPQAFRDVISNNGVLPEITRKLLFSTFDPIYDFHCSFLSELEQRMNRW